MQGFVEKLMASAAGSDCSLEEQKLAFSGLVLHRTQLDSLLKRPFNTREVSMLWLEAVINCADWLIVTNDRAGAQDLLAENFEHLAKLITAPNASKGFQIESERTLYLLFQEIRERCCLCQGKNPNFVQRLSKAIAQAVPKKVGTSRH